MGLNHGTLPAIQIVTTDSFADSRLPRLWKSSEGQSQNKVAFGDSFHCALTSASKNKVGFANPEKQHGDLPGPQTPKKESLPAIFTRSLSLPLIKAEKHVHCQDRRSWQRAAAAPICQDQRPAPKTFSK
jgi:hypothetical protein